MKRSEINKIIKESIDFMESNGFKLPPFAYWDLETWKKNRGSVGEIVSSTMGWDITDYGLGTFDDCGLVLFTLRNGVLGDNLSKPYAEKIMIVREGQFSPMHYHYSKVEDIINRGGATLCIELYTKGDDDLLSDKDVVVSSDGLEYVAKAGHIVRLEPGASITLKQEQYHKFWAEGKGDVLIGEVSSINDDNVDNRFLDKLGRFPEIEEDEPVEFLIVGDYKKILGL